MFAVLHKELTMNEERIKELAEQATGAEEYDGFRYFNKAKFAELIVADYARKTIQGLMSDPAFAQHMDEYYEQKWAHRFD
jgi:hypothetical protein